MSTATIRATQETRNTIRELAEKYGITMQEVVAEAVKTLRRQLFFAELDEACAALEAAPEACQEWQAEIAAWDVTLMDGLEDLEDEDWGEGNPK